MTRVYFVRHAQPDFEWADDRTRPLTAEGKSDGRLVLDVLSGKRIDAFYCSPYLRSMDTISDTAEFFGKEIITDERLRERVIGSQGSIGSEMYRKRWENLDFHEDNGESIGMVQKRNIEALFEILNKEKGKNIVIGTHGTALSSILNYFDPDFGLNDFLRIIDWMPYVIELDFEGLTLVSKAELGHIEKAFTAKAR